MGLLVTTGIWALFAAAAMWPPFRRGRSGFAVFLATMTVNEIPLVLLALLLLGVVDGWRNQVIGGPAGLLAAFLGAVAVLELVWLQVRARTAGPTLSTALEKSGGKCPGGVSTPEWLKGILLPFQRHSRGVERIRNLRYGPEPRAHLLDVYLDGKSQGARPILIHLHGGGFTQGGKSREGVTMLNQLASHGWLCISANYRLGEAGVFPGSLVDAKRVIAWAREHAFEYGADPTRVHLAGSSAGGHLALSAALTADRPDLQPGFEEVDTRVAGVVVLYGYLGPRTSDPSSSPAQLARPDAPPVLIVHGGNDTMVPPEGPRGVAATLRETSDTAVVYAELPHAQHNFDYFASVRARAVANATEVFLDWVRRMP